MPKEKTNTKGVVNFVVYVVVLFDTVCWTFTISSNQPTADANGGNANTTRINDATIETNWDESILSFDEMGLPEDLIRGIYVMGFEKPSAIQQVRKNAFARRLAIVPP